MPAYFESGVFNQVGAWHGMGVVFEGDGPLHADIAIKLANLDWEVEKRPVWTVDSKGNKIPVPGRYEVVRKSDDRILTEKSVGKRYKVINNIQGFQYLNDLVDNDGLEIETAISIYDGSVVTIVARLPEDMEIAGEKVAQYLVFTNPHTGIGSARLLATPVRIVCANTQRMALSGAKRWYPIPHTAGGEIKLQEARDAIRLSFKYNNELQELGESLAAEKIGGGKGFMRFLNELVPLPDANDHPKAYDNAFDVMRSIGTIYKYEENLNDIRPTKWGAMQAVLQHVDHNKTYKTPQRRFEKMLASDDLVLRAQKILVGA